ncbi:MAG TPA: phosphoribosyltransferase family protein [Nitrososphaera sp.]|nr:phosphoribosyltransferase family protein [Nitrososphaera sp.]
MWKKIGYDERKIYEDRKEAAEFLAQNLKKKFGDQLKRENTVILTIPRGGVVTGDVVAERLGVAMDALVSRKVGFPFNPELAIGAVMHDGSFFPNTDIIKMLNVPESYIDEQIAIQMKEIERLLLKFKGSKDYDLEGKFVILVDDGIATGATVFAAINWLRAQKIKKLVVAVPVGPSDTILRLQTVADEVVVLQAPSLFRAVGEFYQDFSQVTDEGVVETMKKYTKMSK